MTIQAQWLTPEQTLTTPDPNHCRKKSQSLWRQTSPVRGDSHKDLILIELFTCPTSPTMAPLETGIYSITNVGFKNSAPSWQMVITAHPSLATPTRARICSKYVPFPIEYCPAHDYSVEHHLEEERPLPASKTKALPTKSTAAIKPRSMWRSRPQDQEWVNEETDTGTYTSVSCSTVGALVLADRIDRISTTYWDVE